MIFLSIQGIAFGQSTSTPPTETQVLGGCRVTVSPYQTGDYDITWDTSFSGTTSSTTYSWTGTDGLSSNQPSVLKRYSTFGQKVANVTVQSGNQSFTLTCSTILSGRSVGSTLPLGGNCNPHVSGMRVSWDAIVGGGGAAAPITFSWSGTEGLVGTSTSVSKIYTTEGIKTATVVMSGAGDTLSLTCAARVASSTSGCFIATAAFGTELEPEVQTLRNFRDKELLTNEFGKIFVNTYYKMSPALADFIRPHENLRSLVRTGLRPIIWSAKYFE